MNRRSFLGALAGAALPAQERRPNIVLLMADDLGYGDLGCYGQSVIQTPNLDRLAAEGMRFTQAYAGSTVCAPSRCTLMTGKHTGHCRVRGNARPEVPLAADDITVAEILKKAGYSTGIFGKWGLGSAGTTGIPNRKGFDEFFGYHMQVQAHTYYPQQLWENESEFVIPGNYGPKKKAWAPDLILPRALNFIEKHRGNPFFLYVPFTMPHANNELGADTGNGMEIPDYGLYSKRSWPDTEKGFAAMVSRLDSDCGRILDKLRDTGLESNTVVVFTSDNGPHKEGGHDPGFFHSGGPLRGIKRDLYEGGIREPTMVRWPGRVRPGQVHDHVWAFWDFLPTCAELAMETPPEGLDGISMVSTLVGRPQRKHEYLYWEFHEHGFSQAVRMGDWKGVRKGARSHPVELYDLASDPGESRNVAAANRSVVTVIESLMEAGRTESRAFPIREAG